MAEQLAGVWIEGKAAGWELDRDDEVIDPRAFDAGIAEFMRNPILAYAHASTVAETVAGPSRYVQLGVVTDLERRGDGLYFKAWAPRPAHGGFLANVWELIRSGAMKGVSVGGRFFKQAAGRISRVDLQEISIAPAPVNPTTLISSVTPSAVAPELTDCGDSCALSIGAEVKAVSSHEDLNAALALAEFAAELHGVRGRLAARQAADVAEARADIRRSMARIGR